MKHFEALSIPTPGTEIVNSWTHVRQALIFSAFAAGSADASAGEPGQTSRTSISISLTVPPRLHVEGLGDSEIKDLLSRGSLSQQVCVVTNSPESTYSVSLLDAENGIDASPENSGAGIPVSVEWSGQGQGAGAAYTRGVQIAQGKTATGLKASSSSGCHIDGNGGAKLTVQPNHRPELALNQSVPPLTLLIAPD